MDRNRRRKIGELMDYLIHQRDQIESTGCYRVDPDLRKAYEFVNQEIQNLQMMTFESQYQEFSRKLSDLLEASNAV